MTRSDDQPNRFVAAVMVAICALALSGCTYADMGVGKSADITQAQALALARDDYGSLPEALDDHPGTGRVVQSDRMISADIALAAADGSVVAKDGMGKPATHTHLRFLHSGVDPDRYERFTFGYVSPMFLAAMAGMREGGRRQLRFADTSCSTNLFPNSCEVFGNNYDAGSGFLRYPRGEVLDVTITVERVCRPLIIVETTPDLMGGGSGRRILEPWCG